MNSLQLVFEDHDVRAVVDEKNEPWFVAKDVAMALGYVAEKNISHLVEKVLPEFKGMMNYHTPGGTQKMICLSEFGVYDFLAQSHKPKALQFRRWLHIEVLPSIRKNGCYGQVTTIPAIAELEARVKALETKALPAPLTAVDIAGAFRQATVAVKPMPARALINQLVKNYTPKKPVEIQYIWGSLYLQFKIRYGIDLKGLSTKKHNSLEIAERLGCIENLYALALELFGGKQS